MGRKPLDPVHTEELLNFAKGKGYNGFSRADAINEGAVAENRWALLRDRTMRSGMIIKRGWKKSARYFHFEFSEKPEELPFLTQDEEVDIEDVDNDFEELDVPFKTNGGVKNYRKEEAEVTEEPEESDEEDDWLNIELDDDSMETNKAFIEDDDDDELDEIINSLQDDSDSEITDDTNWDFDF